MGKMKELVYHGMFDGDGYIPKRDDVRLSGQLNKIFNLMKDGQWRSLRDISTLTGAPEASASAGLRNFRKDKFGGHTVEKKYIERGLFLYRLIVLLPDHKKQIKLL
jgi:hypothetical protein